MAKAWPAVIFGVILAPLVTWLPSLQNKWPVLGLPPYPPVGEAGDVWQMATFWLVVISGIALVVGFRDRWLGLLIGMSALLLWYRGMRLDLTHTVLFSLGCLLLVAVRTIPEGWVTKARWILVCCAAFQIAYLIQQHLGYDFLWGPFFGLKLNPQIQPLGTLNGVDVSAGYVAILSPLLPLWLLPFAALVVWQSHSLGAVAAMIVGLVVHFWPRKERVIFGGVFEKSVISVGGWMAYRPSKNHVIEALIGIVALASLYGSSVYLRKETQAARVGIWQFAGKAWLASDAPLTGWGLGGWKQRVPQLQKEANYAPTKEWWAEAHNEYLQAVMELGLVGAFLMAAWLYTHRRMFIDPTWGGSISALAAWCCTFHPLHIVATALVAILLVGLATRETDPCAV